MPIIALSCQAALGMPMDDATHAPVAIRFGVFEVDLRSGELRKAGVRIKIQEQPFKILVLLLEHPGEVVSREDLRRKIWPNESFGDFDHAVNMAVGKLRATLGDSAETPLVIETLHRRGYRFIAQVVNGNSQQSLQQKENAVAMVGAWPWKRVLAMALVLSGVALGTYRWLRERLTQATAAIMTVVAIAFAIGFVLRAPKPSQPMRLSAEIGADATLSTEAGPSAILSPDGTRLVFVAAASDQKRRMYIRSLDQLQSTALFGTENALDPFFSPDGQWLGFFADGKLKKISVQGGAAVALCDAPEERGGSWGEDGTIVFTPVLRTALSKVSSAGGSPQPLTTLDQHAGEVTHRWPQVLPGGKAVLFTSNVTTGSYEDAEIVVYSMSSGQRKTLLHGGYHPRYLASGHIVYMHEGTLFAMPFDLKRLEVIGRPALILEGVVAVPGNGGAQFSFSETGNLVYVAGRGGFENVSIYWMDSQGKFTPLGDTPGGYLNPAFSPDGKRLALEINDGKRTDIWVYELERDTLTRLTFGGLGNFHPVWTPDGRRITYSSLEKSGEFSLYWKQADGSGDALRLTESKNEKYSQSWRPDGKVLAFYQLSPGTSWDILTLAVEGNEKSGWKPGEAQPFLNSPFSEMTPVFSPDGRWLAYMSDESGNIEVYVRPFPGPGGKWQISTGGGLYPKWSSKGKELFYSTEGSRIMVATYTVSGDTFHADKPRPWSPGQFTDVFGSNYSFDPHPDGKRFVVLKVPGTGEVPKVDKVSFIFNFFEELRRKVPPSKN